MLLLFSSLLIAIVLLIAIILFISPISASPLVFLISPTTSHFDPITRRLNRTWPENVDFTTNPSADDHDGGIVIFDGALPPNTKMEIRGIKAKRIEFNATLSPGCTLLIENCELVTTNADPATDVEGGLVIASTIFTSSDGIYGCSKINSTVWEQYYSSSFSSSTQVSSNIVQIIIRNNTFSNFGSSVQFDGSFPSVVKIDRGPTAAISIYNPVICKNNASSVPATNPTSASSSGFDISIISNKIIMNTVSASGLLLSSPPPAGNEYGRLGIFIFGLPRNTGEALRDFFDSSIKLPSSPESSLFYEPNVSVASLNISDNSFEISGAAFASAIFVGYWDGHSGWNDYLFDNYHLLGAGAAEPVLFEIARNSFDVTSTGSVGSAIFTLGSFGLDDTIQTTNSSRSIPFTINFHNQKKIILVSASYQAVLNLEHLENIASRFKSTVNYYDNNNNDRQIASSSSNFVFNRTEAGGPNSGFSLILIVTNRNDSSLLVSNSDFTFLLQKGGQHSIATISGLGMGNVTIQHTNLFLGFQIPLDPTSIPSFEAFSAWLTFSGWTFVSNVNVLGNTYTDTTNTSNSFFGVEFHRVVAKRSITSQEMAVSEIEGAWGLGVGSLVVRDCVVEMTSLMGLHLVFVAAFVPRMRTISLENNSIVVVTSFASLIRLYSGNYEIMLYFERFICRGNDMKVRHTSAIFAKRSTANFSNFADLVSIPRFKMTQKNNSSSTLSLNFLIENNTFDSFGFQVSRFLWGGSFAEQNTDNDNNNQQRQQMIVIRKNIVIMDSWERSNFLVAAGTPEFSMNIFLLDSNVVTIAASMSSTLIYVFNGTVTMHNHNNKLIPVSINFFLLNNFVNLSTALTGGILTIEACWIDSIFFNNNVLFASVDRTREPIAPQQLSNLVTPSAMRMLAQYRLTTLTATTIEKIYTTTTNVANNININNNIQQVVAVGSSTSIEPKCSHFNNAVLSDRLVSKFLYVSIPALMAMISGNGFPKNEVTVVNNLANNLNQEPIFLCTFTMTRTTEQTPSIDPKINNHSSQRSQLKISSSPTKSLTISDADKNNQKRHHQQQQPQFIDSSKNALSATSTFILSALAAGPSLAAISIRTQSVLFGINQIAAQDCDSTFSLDFLETPPPVASSPMQLYFPTRAASNSGGSNDGGFASGTIVGDALMILILVSVWIAGFYGFERYFSARRKSGKFSCSCRSREAIIKFLAQSKVMIPLYNFSLMFLDPMLNSAIAILVIREVAVGWKLLGVLICVIALTLFFFFYIVVYKLSIQRKKIEHFHKFRPYELKRSENLVLRIWYFLMEPEGEWWCPREGKKITITKTSQDNNNNKKNSSKKNSIRTPNSSHKVTRDDILEYDFATPIFDGFTSRFPLFTIVDLLTVLGMTLALTIGDATANCTVLGVLLLIPLVCHFALAIFFRPDQEMLLQFCIPFFDVLQIILVICALATSSENGGTGKKILDGIAFFLMSGQIVLTVLWVVSIALSAREVILKIWKRGKSTNSRITNTKLFKNNNTNNNDIQLKNKNSGDNNLRRSTDDEIFVRNTKKVERNQPQSENNKYQNNRKNMNDDYNERKTSRSTSKRTGNENHKNKTRDNKNQKNEADKSSSQHSQTKICRSRNDSNRYSASSSSNNNKMKY